MYTNEKLKHIRFEAFTDEAVSSTLEILEARKVEVTKNVVQLKTCIPYVVHPKIGQEMYNNAAKLVTTSTRIGLLDKVAKAEKSIKEDLELFKASLTVQNTLKIVQPLEAEDAVLYDNAVEQNKVLANALTKQNEALALLNEELKSATEAQNIISSIPFKEADGARKKLIALAMTELKGLDQRIYAGKEELKRRAKIKAVQNKEAVIAEESASQLTSTINTTAEVDAILATFMLPKDEELIKEAKHAAVQVITPDNIDKKIRRAAIKEAKKEAIAPTGDKIQIA